MSVRLPVCLSVLVCKQAFSVFIFYPLCVCVCGGGGECVFVCMYVFVRVCYYVKGFKNKMGLLTPYACMFVPFPVFVCVYLRVYVCVCV